uniref:ANK_REP_REGION domain-containing protein n=1 Tax=Macrostomum lignano TaxID=282301 RepID=A0A1I8FDS9_9PLAT
GNSPLHLAARHCRYRLLRQLYEHVESTKSITTPCTWLTFGNKEGETALHYAAELSKDKAGGDFDEHGPDCGDAACTIAPRSGNEDILLEIVKFLDHRIQLV